MHAYPTICISRQRLSYRPLYVPLALRKLKEELSMSARWVRENHKDTQSGADPGQREMEEASETRVSYE